MSRQARRGARGRARPRDHQLQLVLALDDVLGHGRADDLPDRVRLRLRVAGLRVGGYDYVDFVGTGTVATAVLFSSVLPAMFGDVREVQVPAHVRRDPRRAGRRGGARHRRGAVARDARVGLRLRADDRGDVLRPGAELGMLLVPVHQLHRGLRLGVRGRRDRGLPQGHRELQLRHERGDHAAVPVRRLVLPDRRLPDWAQLLAELNPLFHCRSSPSSPLRVQASTRLRRCSPRRGTARLQPSRCGGWRSGAAGSTLID